MTDSPNSEQAEFWSTGGGINWVTLEPQLDALFANVNATLIKTANPQLGQTILDIGCGTGSTTRSFATAVGPSGHVHGMDISTSLLNRAVAQAAPNTSFTLADAQTHALPEHHYDHVISRFGVMFFDDPVAAFQNLNAALKPDGTLTMACWAPFKQNPWFTIPRRVATELLGAPPPFSPRAPGPFAFADTDYATSILTQAGFSAASVTTHDIALTLPGSAKDAAHLSSYIGPADSVIREQGGTSQDKAKIVATVVDKLTPFETNGAVTVPSKIHLYTAKR